MPALVIDAPTAGQRMTMTSDCVDGKQVEYAEETGTMIMVRNDPRQIALLMFVTAFVFTGYASTQRAGQSVTIQTGRVVGAEAVNLQSRAGRGVAAGGLLGYETTSSRMGSSRRARNTLLGAAAGGM